MFKMLVLLLVAGAATLVQAENLTWDAAGGNWDDAGNWAGGGKPDTTDDTVTFGDTGDGSANTNDISGLTITSFTVSDDNTHTTDLGGNTLTVKDLSLNAPTAGQTATLNVTNAGTLIVTNSLALAKTAGGSDVESAVMTVAAGVTLQVGVSTNSRGAIYVGDSNDHDCDASLTAGELFNAYLTTLVVGRRPGYDATPVSATLDLSAVTNDAVLDISGDVIIGYGRRPSGTVTLSDAVDLRIGTASSRGGSLTISHSSSLDSPNPASSLTTGGGRFDAYITDLFVARTPGAHGVLNATNCAGGVLDISGDVYINAGVGGARDTTGEVNLKNIDVTIGSPAARSEFRMAESDDGGNPYYNLLRVEDGAFTGYFEDFLVGIGSIYYRICTVDLQRVTSGVLNISSNLHLGVDWGENGSTVMTLGSNFTTTVGSELGRAEIRVAAGLRPGPCTLNVSGSFSAYLTDLLIGTNSFASDDAIGTFDLTGVTNGSLLDVTDNVILGGGANATGDLDLTVPGTSGGLDMGPSATLTVESGSLIDITFQNTSGFGVYWGLRWEGDHVAALQALTNAPSRLTWDDSPLVSAESPVTIFKDDTYTYVGVDIPPPPGTIVIMR